MDRAAFDRLYRGGTDPYGLRTRWYEMRKRAIVLAALPRARYARAFEPACGIGVLMVTNALFSRLAARLRTSPMLTRSTIVA